MAAANPTDCERDPTLSRLEDQSTERAVLAFLLDEHPERRLTIPEAALAIGGSDVGFAEGDDIERAIRELVGAGLLRIESRCGYVVPTRAAVYFDHLERD